MGRRRRISDGETIEIDYRGREIAFREDLDEWHCHSLNMKAKSLTALKRKIDKTDGEARRVSCPCIRLPRYSSSEGQQGQIVMIAKESDWESLRYDEKPELMSGLHSRRVPTVWLLVPNGNQPPERKKDRLDELAPVNESTLLSLKEAERLRREASRLGKEADAIIAAIPRLTMDDLQRSDVRPDEGDEA